MSHDLRVERHIGFNNRNTHSMNCTPLTAAAVTAVLELLHGPNLFPQPPLILHLSFCLLLHGQFLSPQTSQIQFSPISGQCVECKVPRELLLHTDQLMSPLEIGENWI